jgi:hypothetical protein
MPAEVAAGLVRRPSLTAMEWVKVYDLSQDQAHIHAVQQASLDEGPFGLKQEPALFGSPEWWEAIERGDVARRWIEGVIEAPIWTGMNDFPEVVIREDSGAVSHWVRWGDVTQYAKGRRIRLCWVMQRAKVDIARLGSGREVVLEVWVEGGTWRPTAAYGPGPGRSLDEGWEGGPA